MRLHRYTLTAACQQRLISVRAGGGEHHVEITTKTNQAEPFFLRFTDGFTVSLPSGGHALLQEDPTPTADQGSIRKRMAHDVWYKRHTYISVQCCIT